MVQVSRFDKWKDPQGTIDAFQIARKQIDCRLVLVGNIATDDPEGQDVFSDLCQRAEDRIRVLSVQDSALVNALQRKAAVVVQKSIKEGFGLTVTEAMWKGAAVGGASIAWFGIVMPFWINAISNLSIVVALLWWREPRRAKTLLPTERFGGAIITGLRYARHNLHLRRTLVRAIGFFLFASAYWALLPLVA